MIAVENEEPRQCATAPPSSPADCGERSFIDATTEAEGGAAKFFQRTKFSDGNFQCPCGLMQPIETATTRHHLGGSVQIGEGGAACRCRSLEINQRHE